MISKLLDRLNDYWLIRFLQTSVIYIIIMIASLLVGSLIAGRLVFESNILIIFFLVLVFNFIISIFDYFKLQYLFIIISITLCFASFSSILLATKNLNGWEYFQATVTLIMFLAVALAIGIVVHISMYLLTGMKSSETLKNDQPLLKKLLLVYIIILTIITVMIIFTTNPNVQTSDTFNDQTISKMIIKNIALKISCKYIF